MRWHSCIAIGLLLAANQAAQAEDCLHRKLPVLLVNSKTSLPVTIEEGKLRGQVGGKPVNIRSLTFSTGVRRAIVVLDGSGSMNHQWKAAVEFARFIVRNSPQDMEVGLVTFSDRFSEQIAPGSRSKKDILQRLDQYLTLNRLPQGGTPLWDGLEHALTAVGSGQRLDSIFLITDGGDNKSKEGSKQVGRKLAIIEARLFCLMFTEHNFPAEEQRIAFEDLTRLATASGGWVYPADQDESLSDPKRQAMAEAQVEHVLQVRPAQLEIELPQAIDKFSEWKLQYVNEEGARAKQHELFYPHLLAPCTAEQATGK